MPNYIRVKQLNNQELSGFVGAILVETGALTKIINDISTGIVQNITSGLYVDRKTNQIITGNKTFVNDVNVSGNLTVLGDLRYNQIIDITTTGDFSGNAAFFNTVEATNLVYNTGDQTINGIKNFSVNSSSRVLISGAQNGQYALSLVNNSNQGNVLYLKKGATIGGGAFAENFVIKAVDKTNDLIFALKSSQIGANRAGFFCDPDEINDIGGPSIQQDSVVVSGKTYLIDNQLKYIISDSNSIQAVNPIYSYTGGLIFNESGLYLSFVNPNNGLYPDLYPVQITTGNDVLINGNTSFGNYVKIYEYTNSKLFQTNFLRYQLQDIPISGLKTGNIINIFSEQIKTSHSNLGKSYQYIMIDGPIINSRNTINITNGAYSGKALRRFKTGPTIANGYKVINSLESGGALILPRQKYLETVYDINVLSGKGDIRPLTLQTPTITTANNSIITLKFNFQADTGVCIVSGRYPNLTPIFNITGANYDFVQKERLMYHVKEGTGAYVRI